MPTLHACPRIAITAGEPAGIGPDLCVQLAQQPLDCQLVVIADPTLLGQRAAQLGLPLTLRLFDAQQPARALPAGELWIWPCPLPSTVQCGLLNPTNSAAVVESIRLATVGCLEQTFDAMVTAPVHKAVINDAGIAFTGHTEWIAEICQATPVMMLATPGLRVALATTHLPLAAVSAAITQAALTETLQILHHDLRQQFGIQHPHIRVCGLNPHAGENGHLGQEEITTIIPVIQALAASGLHITGPYPADTLFTPALLADTDAVLAMYHDQGLPVLKHMGFGQAVNVTLGLPIIRTSVDHGTALDLAGTGRADIGSLRYALHTALQLCHSRAHP